MTDLWNIAVNLSGHLRRDFGRPRPLFGIRILNTSKVLPVFGSFGEPDMRITANQRDFAYS